MREVSAGAALLAQSTGKYPHRYPENKFIVFILLRHASPPKILITLKLFAGSSGQRGYVLLVGVFEPCDRESAH